MAPSSSGVSVVSSTPIASAAAAEPAGAAAAAAEAAAEAEDNEDEDEDEEEDDDDDGSKAKSKEDAARVAFQLIYVLRGWVDVVYDRRAAKRAALHRALCGSGRRDGAGALRAGRSPPRRSCVPHCPCRLRHGAVRNKTTPSTIRWPLYPTRIAGHHSRSDRWGQS